MMEVKNDSSLSSTRMQSGARESSGERGNWCGEARGWRCPFIGAGGRWGGGD
jgi:hypothetical protein